MTQTTDIPPAEQAESRASRILHTISAMWTRQSARSSLLAGLAGFFVYEVSREPGAQVYNQYVRLADSFLHGKLYVIDPAPWLELVTYHGHKYSHQGVLPAILLMPFVGLFGPDFNLRHFAALVGGGISMTAWSLATRIGLDGWRRFAGWAFPVLGTTIWYEAKLGSTWGVASLVSALFLFLSLNEYFGLRKLLLVGMFVGLASLARPPAILALIGFVVAVRNPRKIAQLAMGVLGPLAVMLAYDYVRFGELFGAQRLHYMQDNYRFQRPPGQFSPAHVPFNLYSWFFLGPQFQPNFPYVRLTIMGTALPITSPAFVTAFAARRERWLWLAAVAAIVPAALNYGSGFSQFGMRYLLDAVPFLTALIFLALRDRRGFGYVPLLVASIAINAYGVAYTTVFGLK